MIRKLLAALKSSPVLRYLSRPKPASGKPAVSEDTLQHLRELCGTPQWVRYKVLLDLLVSNNVEALLATSDTSQVHYLRGYCQGLLHSAQVPEQLIAQDDNARRRKQSATATELSRAESAAASLYSSGYWGN